MTGFIFRITMFLPCIVCKSKSKKTPMDILYKLLVYNILRIICRNTIYVKWNVRPKMTMIFKDATICMIDHTFLLLCFVMSFVIFDLHDISITTDHAGVGLQSEHSSYDSWNANLLVYTYLTDSVDIPEIQTFSMDYTFLK